MKRQNTQVHRQGGKKTVNPQAPTKPKSTQTRSYPTADEMRCGRLPARNVVKPGRGNPEAQLAALSAALGLTPDGVRILDLVSEWEGMSPRDYCMYSIIGGFESSYSDLMGFAQGRDGGRPKERDWALQFYPRVKPHFTKNGDLKSRCHAATATAAKSEVQDRAQPVKLVFSALESGDPVGDLEMSGELYHWVAIAAQAAGQSVGDFIAQGVFEKVRRLKAGALETTGGRVELNRKAGAR